MVLAAGTFRRTTLKPVVLALVTEEAITQRMLTLCLRGLERDGFVSRATESTKPPCVSDALTPLGASLVAQFRHLQGWIFAHAGHLDAARAAFDAGNDP